MEKPPCLEELQRLVPYYAGDPAAVSQVERQVVGDALRDGFVGMILREIESSDPEVEAWCR